MSKTQVGHLLTKQESEQKLIDLMFQMVLVCTSEPEIYKKPRGERMAWVANNLRAAGYDTHPFGGSWGELVIPEFRSKHQKITDNLDYANIHR